MIEFWSYGGIVAPKKNMIWWMQNFSQAVIVMYAQSPEFFEVIAHDPSCYEPA